MPMIPAIDPAGWERLLKAALLVSIRISGLFVFAPVFSSQALPPKVKSVFLLVLTVVLAPIAAAIPSSHIEVDLRSILGEVALAALLGIGGISEKI